MAKRKLRVVLGKPVRRSCRYYVSRDGTPHHIYSHGRRVAIWIRVRRGSPTDIVDRAGRHVALFITDPSAWLNPRIRSGVEVHTYGVEGRAIIKDKKLWVDEGL